MSNNEKIKTGLTAFFLKALPWAIVFSAGLVIGFIVGAK